MTEAAIISGSLVDVRNVGTHKSVKLTIHVPEELAMKVMEAFGWPTGVSPIAVAIARLDQPVSQRGTSPLPGAGTKPAPAQPSVPAEPVRADKEKRKFGEITPAQQAGILCNEEPFRKFLRERFLSTWNLVGGVGALGGFVNANDCAAACVREICQVDSRADIKPDNALWSALVLDYRLWQREPEFIGAA